MRKISIVIYIGTLLLGCKDRDISFIDYDDLVQVNVLSDVIDSYYISKGSLPNSKEDIKDFYGSNTDILFKNHIQPDKKIKYIPIYKKSKTEPYEYFIISTNKNADKILSDRKRIQEDMVTVCEYNQGKGGDILLYHSTPFLISSKQALLELEDALIPHWKNRVYFNVGFTIDTTVLFKENSLNFIYKQDSVIINGAFYNEQVKEKVISLLKKNNSVELQGLKVRNLNNNEFVLKDIIPRMTNNNTGNKYRNEIGDIEEYIHLRGCE